MVDKPPDARRAVVDVRGDPKPHRRDAARRHQQRVQPARDRVAGGHRHRTSGAGSDRLASGVDGGEHLLPPALPTHAGGPVHHLLPEPFERLPDRSELSHRLHSRRTRDPSPHPDGATPHAAGVRRRWRRLRAEPVCDCGKRERQSVCGHAVDARRVGHPRRLRDLAPLAEANRQSDGGAPPDHHDLRRPRDRTPLRGRRCDRRRNRTRPARDFGGPLKSTTSGMRDRDFVGDLREIVGDIDRADVDQEARRETSSAAE